jgi:hypothetical protein
MEEPIIGHVSEYLDTALKLTVVNATQQATVVASVSLMAILIGFLFMLVLFFGSLGVSLWLGELVNNSKVGFFIVCGIYLLVAVLMLVLRKKTLFPFVQNLIIQKVYEQH